MELTEQQLKERFAFSNNIEKYSRPNSKYSVDISAFTKQDWKSFIDFLASTPVMYLYLQYTDKQMVQQSVVNNQKGAIIRAFTEIDKAASVLFALDYTDQNIKLLNHLAFLNQDKFSDNVKLVLLSLFKQSINQCSHESTEDVNLFIHQFFVPKFK